MIKGLKTVIYPVTAWAAPGCRCVPPRTATTTVGGIYGLRVTAWCHRGVTRHRADTTRGSGFTDK